MCDLSVTAQRAERNTYVMSRVVPSEWSLELWKSTVADAQAGYMTPPVPVHHLEHSLISLTRRPPVREERPKGKKTRSVDHFTESGINPATRPQDALTHETADHFISLLVMYMSVGVAPLMWKRDVAQAFRKVPIKYDATDLSWVVFLHAGVLWASHHSGPRLPTMRGTVLAVSSRSSLLRSSWRPRAGMWTTSRLRPGGLHGHGRLLPDSHVQSARLPFGP